MCEERERLEANRNREISRIEKYCEYHGADLADQAIRRHIASCPICKEKGNDLPE